MSTNNYRNMNDIFDNVFLRPTSQLNTSTIISVDLHDESYVYSNEIEVNLMSIVLIASVDVLKYRSKNIVIVNNGPDNMDDILVQASPNNVDWETIDSTISGLVNGTSKSISISDCRKYYRVIGNSMGTSNLKCYLNGFTL